jgi:oligopeptidase B
VRYLTVIRAVFFCMSIATAAVSSEVPGAASSRGLTPPVAKRIPKSLVTHGDKRIDDYFWLREKTNAGVTAYLEAENAYADAVMQPLTKFREGLYQEILGHLKETDTSAPVRRGEFFYRAMHLTLVVLCSTRCPTPVPNELPV